MACGVLDGDRIASNAWRRSSLRLRTYSTSRKQPQAMMGSSHSVAIMVGMTVFSTSQGPLTPNETALHSWVQLDSDQQREEEKS
ncbi:hypothetical protein AGDE_15547 [Angomonas deanei]|uniref:Uncharacterized protein n=1 Tax=Angomonas deanei TaxID=59799 RepID=A0A7G2CT89_9TRYP|nr:hypothetical protein AGDE_15547 [Angomonas deanei]CAD2222499.1 hypothetical protein, conserved [Angomonas deanei]|eukprot:EPY18878.1 hypothetical protein AGDE_15547 [Angomonas deanei]